MIARAGFGHNQDSRHAMLMRDRQVSLNIFKKSRACGINAMAFEKTRINLRMRLGYEVRGGNVEDVFEQTGKAELIRCLQRMIA